MLSCWLPACVALTKPGQSRRAKRPVLTCPATPSVPAVLADACPSPEAFSIVCRTDQVPSCGPGAKPIKLDDLCTAFPLGAKLQWIRANVERDSLNGTAYAASSNFTTPAVAYCPAGANGTNVWYPYITSFNGRVNCFCTADTSCKFTAQGQTSTDSAFAVTNFNPAINITLHGERHYVCSRTFSLLPVGVHLPHSMHAEDCQAASPFEVGAV